MPCKVVESADEWIKKFEPLCARPWDSTELLKYHYGCTNTANYLKLIDVIGEVTFSKRFGFMDAGKDDGSFASIEAALRSAAW